MNMRGRPYLKNVACWFRRWFEMRDNPSTELALIKLLSEQTELFRVLASRISHLEHNTQHRHEALMIGLETLTNSVNANVSGQSALTTAVNAAIVRLNTPSPTDAQLLTLAGQIDSSTNSDDALTRAIEVALGNLPVVTPKPTPPPNP